MSLLNDLMTRTKSVLEQKPGNPELVHPGYAYAANFDDEFPIEEGYECLTSRNGLLVYGDNRRWMFQAVIRGGKVTQGVLSYASGRPVYAYSAAEYVEG